MIDPSAPETLTVTLALTGGEVVSLFKENRVLVARVAELERAKREIQDAIGRQQKALGAALDERQSATYDLNDAQAQMAKFRGEVEDVRRDLLQWFARHMAGLTPEASEQASRISLALDTALAGVSK